MRNTPVSFTERLALDDSYSLQLITGHVEGVARWSFLLLPTGRLDDLSRALATRQVALEDYGEILAQGEGEEPPEELAEELYALITRK